MACKRLTVEEFETPPPGGWGGGYNNESDCICGAFGCEANAYDDGSGSLRCPPGEVWILQSAGYCIKTYPVDCGNPDRETLTETLIAQCAQDFGYHTGIFGCPQT